MSLATLSPTDPFNRLPESYGLGFVTGPNRLNSAESNTTESLPSPHPAAQKALDLLSPLIKKAEKRNAPDSTYLENLQKLDKHIRDVQDGFLSLEEGLPRDFQEADRAQFDLFLRFEKYIELLTLCRETEQSAPTEEEVGEERQELVKNIKNVKSEIKGHLLSRSIRLLIFLLFFYKRYAELSSWLTELGPKITDAREKLKSFSKEELEDAGLQPLSEMLKSAREAFIVISMLEPLREEFNARLQEMRAEMQVLQANQSIDSASQLQEEIDISDNGQQKPVGHGHEIPLYGNGEGTSSAAQNRKTADELTAMHRKTQEQTEKNERAIIQLNKKITDLQKELEMHQGKQAQAEKNEEAIIQLNEKIANLQKEQKMNQRAQERSKRNESAIIDIERFIKNQCRPALTLLEKIVTQLNAVHDTTTDKMSDFSETVEKLSKELAAFRAQYQEMIDKYTQALPMLENKKLSVGKGKRVTGDDGITEEGQSLKFTQGDYSSEDTTENTGGNRSSEEVDLPAGNGSNSNGWMGNQSWFNWNAPKRVVVGNNKPRTSEENGFTDQSSSKKDQQYNKRASNMSSGSDATLVGEDTSATSQPVKNPNTPFVVVAELGSKDLFRREARIDMGGLEEVTL